MSDLMRLFGGRQKTLMSGKFFSMLFGGTMTMMVVSILLMSDSVIAGIFVGADAVVGVTLVAPVYSLSAFLGSVFALGFPIVYSEEMGKFNKRGADQIFGFGLLMSIVVGVVLFLLLLLFGDAYLKSNRPSASALDEARSYLGWMRFTILIFPLHNFLLEAVYTDGDESLCSIAEIVQGIGNITASILLSRVMGISGIGLASFMFTAVVLLLLSVHFLKKRNSLRPNLYFSINILKTVVRYSIIDSSAHLFLTIQIAILNAFISAEFGADYLILVSVILLCREFQLVFDGVGEAITPIVSVYLGEECYSGVRSTYKQAEKVAVAEGIVVMLIVFFSATFISLILDINDTRLIRLAVFETRMIAFGSVFVSLLYLLTSYYLLIEKITLGIIVLAMRDILLAIPLVVMLAKVFGLYGLFVGIMAAPAVSYLLVLLYISCRYGKENCPLFLGLMRSDIRSELFNLRTEPDQIMNLQAKIGAMLRENGIDQHIVGHVELLIEELYMLIREKNGGKAVLSECIVLLRPEGVQIISKDEGVIFDVSEEDAAITSLNAFVVASFMEKIGQNKQYLTTMSFNRSVFLFKTGQK